MLNLGKIVTLDDNKDYATLDTVNYLGNEYCCLIGLDDFNNIKIYQKYNNNLLEIKNDDLIRDLSELFITSLGT